MCMISFRIYTLYQKGHRKDLHLRLIVLQMEEHRKFVYSEDYDALKVELEEAAHGERDRHNMQYRWLDKEGVPVWINCRGKVLREADGRPHFLIGSINEIGQQQKAGFWAKLLLRAG